MSFCKCLTIVRPVYFKPFLSNYGMKDCIPIKVIKASVRRKARMLLRGKAYTKGRSAWFLLGSLYICSEGTWGLSLKWPLNHLRVMDSKRSFRGLFLGALLLLFPHFSVGLEPSFPGQVYLSESLLQRLHLIPDQTRQWEQRASPLEHSRWSEEGARGGLWCELRLAVSMRIMLKRCWVEILALWIN